MDISLINSQSLLHLLGLTEKKEELLQVLDQIDAEIIRTLQGGISVEVIEVAAAPAVVPPAPKAKTAPAKPAKKKSKPVKSGGLKARILALLEAAGDEGLKVREIADKLGSKPGNIAVWFSTTGKNITTKLAPGRFAKKETAKAAAPAAKRGKTKVKAKKKGGITPEGRARLAANMKARWAARKAAAKAR
jgi:hypothetical protein